jgi:hypothetical protein
MRFFVLLILYLFVLATTSSSDDIAPTSFMDVFPYVLGYLLYYWRVVFHMKQVQK